MLLTVLAGAPAVADDTELLLISPNPGSLPDRKKDAALYAMILRPHSDRRETTYRIGDAEKEKKLYHHGTGPRSLPRPLDCTGRTLIVPDMSEPRMSAQNGRFVYMRPEYLRQDTKRPFWRTCAALTCRAR